MDIMLEWARVGKLHDIPAPNAHLMCPLAVAVNSVALITHL